MKILLVEDHQADAVIILQFLKNLGYPNVTIADNGHEALKQLESSDFDLIITDWMMPMMDGLTLVRTIRKQEMTRTPILMLTSRTRPEDLVRALQAGIDDFMIKPPRLDVLRSKVEQALQKP